MTRKKIYLLLFVLLVISYKGYSQGKAVLGQYFQNLPAFSPSFTGANDFLDIRTGFRKQWAGFKGAPTTGYLSIYSPIRIKDNRYPKNSLRSNSNSGNYTKNKRSSSGVRLGIGGYILIDEKGPFKEQEGLVSFAVHIPVKENTFLSMGVSAGILSSSIDLGKLTIEDNINDPIFTSLINSGSANSSFNINGSIGIHSDSYYLSYSAMQLSKTIITGNDQFNTGKAIRHHIIGGYRFFVSQNVELIPNTFVRIESNLPLFYEAGVRARFNQNFWFGVSYRNDNSAVGMLGFAFSDKVNFGYAYEFKSTDFNNFNSGSHEINIGLRLFNYSNYTSIW